MSNFKQNLHDFKSTIQQYCRDNQTTYFSLEFIEYNRAYFHTMPGYKLHEVKRQDNRVIINEVLV